MQLSFESLDLIKTMAIEGNPNSVSDAGVGALCARSAVMGAFMNVRINASGLDDKKFVRLRRFRNLLVTLMYCTVFIFFIVFMSFTSHLLILILN